jgi:GNAT superfamily N-acetyltransferase
MGLVVRPAAPADAGAIASLLSELGYPVSGEFAAQQLAEFAREPRSLVAVAVDGGTVVGLVATHVVPRLDSDVRSCRIVDIVVAASRRRSGVGSALLAAAEAEARHQDCRRIDLSTGDWRGEAHQFYERMGFESRSRGYLKRLT